jgi:hypothetical protein
MMAESSDDSGTPGDKQAQQQDLQTPEALIAATVELLLQTKDIDTALLDILSTTVLTRNPAGTAVSDALPASQRPTLAIRNSKAGRPPTTRSSGFRP